MESTAQLAGFFAAHAVWCVSEGETLIPLVAFQGPGDERKMHRFAAELIEDGVAQGKDWLARNPESASRGVLVYDGFVTLPTGKTDALIIETMQYDPEPRGFTMAVPYRHAGSPRGFAVYRPKFMGFEGPQPDFDRLGDAFFRGVDEHEKGAAVWTAHLDQSQ